MKAKIFTLVAALMLIMTMCVCALPAPADVVETVSEEAQEPYTSSESTADVMAEASVVPGKNVYTGDTNVETFDGFAADDISAMFFIPGNISMSAVEDATNGTVIKATYGGDAEDWVTFYSPISYKINRRAFYYINYKLDPGSVGHVTGKDELESYSWVINLAGDKKNFGIPVTTMGSWLTATNDNEQCIWGDKLHSFNMKFAPGGNVYVDNYALVPYYQITYKNVDKNGNSLGDDTVVYYLTDSSITVADGEISGIATSYPVASTVLTCDDNTVFFGGWSTTQGGDAEAVVALNGEDIVLYPVWYEVSDKTIVYETFEDVAEGTYISKYSDTELDSDGRGKILLSKALNMNSRGILSSAKLVQGDQKANMSVVDFGDGNSVLKVTKVVGYSTSWRMVTFNLYTNGSTGLTSAQPGKYVISCRYYIDETDPSTYNSITGRISIGNSQYPSVGKGNSVTKGAWHDFTQEFEVTKDGTVVYGTNTKTYLNSLVRFDFVNNYGAATGDVLYYLDDVMVTYEPSRYLTFNFTDSSANAIKSVDIIHYDEEGAILPKASELGLEYDVVYTVNGKKYYPGQHVVLDKTVTTVDVKVSNSNMIFFESFDNRNIDRQGEVMSGGKGFTPEYVSPLYDEIGYSPIIIGGDSGGSQSYKTTTESGRKVLAVKRFKKTDGLYSMYMESRFLGTGTYYYTVTYKASGDTLSNANMNMQTKLLDANINFAKERVNFPADEDGYRTVTYEIKVYDDADGVRKADFTNSPDNVYSEKTFNRIMFYWWGPKVEGSDETIYIDEISIEYKPFAPGEVNLKSYRDIAPVGIRFASYVTDAQKAQSSEYGFIVTRKVFLENAASAAGEGTYTDYLYVENDDVIGTSTTLVTNDAGVAMVGAAAYNDKVNKIYATDGSYFGSSKYLGLNDAITFFTGVVTGIDDEQKDEVFAVRPYIKIDGVYYFGTIYEASFNDVYNAANS